MPPATFTPAELAISRPQPPDPQQDFDDHETLESKERTSACCFFCQWAWEAQEQHF